MCSDIAYWLFGKSLLVSFHMNMLYPLILLYPLRRRLKNLRGLFSPSGNFLINVELVIACRSKSWVEILQEI